MQALLKIYNAPEHHYHLYNLCEALVEHDQCILMWRFHHVRVVERLIGTKHGTGGSSGVKYLDTTHASAPIRCCGRRARSSRTRDITARRAASPRQLRKSEVWLGGVARQGAGVLTRENLVVRCRHHRIGAQ